MKERLEHDSMGEISVEADKYWGAQTERSRRNFKVGKGLEQMPDEIIVEQNQYSARGTKVPTTIYRYKNVIAGYTHWYWAENPFLFNSLL